MLSNMCEAVSDHACRACASFGVGHVWSQPRSRRRDMLEDELGVCDGAASMRRFVAVNSAPFATPSKDDQDLDSDEEAAAADSKGRKKSRGSAAKPKARVRVQGECTCIGCGGKGAASEQVPGFQ